MELGLWLEKFLLQTSLEPKTARSAGQGLTYLELLGHLKVVLQMRRGKQDNLGIISHSTPLTHML